MGQPDSVSLIGELIEDWASDGNRNLCIPIPVVELET